MNPEPLSSIAEFLNAAGWNYSVFLHAYALPSVAGTPPEQIIANALGSTVVVADLKVVTAPEVVSEVGASISYAGDSGAGPDPASLQSERFAELLSGLLKETETVARGADRIEQFRFKDGHPAYPVFWDFAFLFVGPVESVVLVGSSSD